MFIFDVMCVDIYCLFVYFRYFELIVRGWFFRFDWFRGIGEWIFNFRIIDLGY